MVIEKHFDGCYSERPVIQYKKMKQTMLCQLHQKKKIAQARGSGFPSPGGLCSWTDGKVCRTSLLNSIVHNLFLFLF
jgi:hypothetical protein